MKPKDIPYLIWDSVKSMLVVPIVEILDSLKDPKTWSFILYATVFMAVYYKSFEIVKLAVPIIVVLYMVRRLQSPEYNKALRKRAYLKNDEEYIKKEYDKYKKICFFSKKDPLSYEEYKKEELKKLDEKHIESGLNGTQ